MHTLQINADSILDEKDCKVKLFKVTLDPQTIYVLAQDAGTAVGQAKCVIEKECVVEEVRFVCQGWGAAQY